MNTTMVRFASEHALRIWLDAGGGAACEGEGGASTKRAAGEDQGGKATRIAACEGEGGASTKRAERWVTAAWVSDRFGQYGLVACALCSLGRGEIGREGAVVVECFNMSCRVLQRGVEHALLRGVAREAEACGARAVWLPIIPTAVVGQVNLARIRRESDEKPTRIESSSLSLDQA
jgi:hypothetical protein